MKMMNTPSKKELTTNNPNIVLGRSVSTENDSLQIHSQDVKTMHSTSVYTKRMLWWWQRWSGWIDIDGESKDKQRKPELAYANSLAVRQLQRRNWCKIWLSSATLNLKCGIEKKHTVMIWTFIWNGWTVFWWTIVNEFGYQLMRILGLYNDNDKAFNYWTTGWDLMIIELIAWMIAWLHDCMIARFMCNVWYFFA